MCNRGTIDGSRESQQRLGVELMTDATDIRRKETKMVADALASLIF